MARGNNGNTIRTIINGFPDRFCMVGRNVLNPHTKQREVVQEIVFEASYPSQFNQVEHLFYKLCNSMTKDVKCESIAAGLTIHFQKWFNKVQINVPSLDTQFKFHKLRVIHGLL